MRRGEAGDVAEAGAGAPCLRRKYRGVVVAAAAFWPGAGPVRDPSVRFPGDGDNGEDARAPLRRRGGGCRGLDAGSVGRGELGLGSVPPKSGLAWEDGAENPRCE